ncbi:MAG: YggS family pyridoxal phosphate-dependent enzyme [Anaerolineae bacterium]|nr:YggS family pyridoxal phosphate-dependent enzyme [Anaerolineae bacterium]
MDYAEQVRHNVDVVGARIAEAAARAGRDPAGVTLVAISKTFPPSAVLAGYRAGLRHFGENRPEEGAEKVPQVNALVDGLRPTWHMVGHVQSRKADLTVAHFDVVHSVDRLKVARRLSHFAAEAGRELPVLLECNVSGEQGKYGFPVDRWQADPAQREAFFAACAEILALPALQVSGVMTVAPWVDDAAVVRATFAGLRALRDALRERFPAQPWPALSMGMTDDFEIAVEEGATMVRIGRALFGPRPTV